MLDNGKHGNHGNDENHGNPVCKQRVPHERILEIPERHPSSDHACSQRKETEAPKRWKHNHPNSERNALGVKVILGATLGIPGHSWSNARKYTHDLCHVRAQLSEQFSERALVSHEKPKFRPKFSVPLFFFNWCGPRAPNTLGWESIAQGSISRFLDHKLENS